MFDRRFRIGFNGIFKARGKAYRPQHAQLVFGKAPLRIAYGANDAGFEVLASADKVKHFSADWIEHQAVDGEVAARDILTRIFAEADYIGMASVGIPEVASEGRYLNRFCFGRVFVCVLALRRRHQDYAKLRANRIGFGEDLHYLCWGRAGGDVVI